ncbi:MAG: HAD hydrolase-like protein [Solirubrobacterales bacterium]|nr:HAD hydrolase-like protein [Solirubrobacterales bacterium]MBV9941110.1 HAD hydrolase-like protein [Solirubrobacterales bacterium]
MANEGSLKLTQALGFVFDVDGTLVHRGPDFRARPVPRAVEVLERIRRSGRRLVLFTNGSHVPAQQIARSLSDDGLPVADDEVLTPVESAITYLRHHHPGRRVFLFSTDVIRERIAAAGIPLASGEDAELVLVTHADDLDIAALERAAHAVRRGARLLTGSYVPGFAGANGMVLSRGAMITAAIAKVSGGRPQVVGKPSRAAVGELRTHFKLPTQKLAVIGDDLALDIRLGRMGGSQTVLVRSGTSGQIDLDSVPARLQPDAVIDTVADLLDSL